MAQPCGATHRTYMHIYIYIYIYIYTHCHAEHTGGTYTQTVALQIEHTRTLYTLSALLSQTHTVRDWRYSHTLHLSTMVTKNCQLGGNKIFVIRIYVLLALASPSKRISRTSYFSCKHCTTPEPTGYTYTAASLERASLHRGFG